MEHARVGGTTTATGMYGTRGFGPVNKPVDPIRRFIGHVLKYSERPVPSSIPVQEDHYTVDHRLSLNKLDEPVVFLSGFSPTGWGKRPLVAVELAQAFDLPSYLCWSPECSGVDVEVDGKIPKLLRWTRIFMGLRPSPYCAVRYYYWGEEFARGDPSESSNPMGYDTI